MSKLARSLELAGLVERPGDPADSRAVRLALTPAGVDVARQAIAVVAELLERLLAPLGGVRSRRTAAFVGELQTLLAAPLSPQPEGAD